MADLQKRIFPEVDLPHVCGDLNVIAQTLSLGDDFFLAEEGSQLEEIIDEIGILEVCDFAAGLEVVEDVVLFEDELKHNDAHWPDIRLECLLRVMQDRLHRHV